MITKQVLKYSKGLENSWFIGTKEECETFKKKQEKQGYDTKYELQTNPPRNDSRPSKEL
jgi:hypothetical protein